jgi:uncharacterized metal-binding protein YceD (DUF177 family)
MPSPGKSAPEFSRMVDARKLPGAPLSIAADQEEREALAKRFGLIAIDRLEAKVEFEPDGTDVIARGRMQADFTQICAVSGDDLPMVIDDNLLIRFMPENANNVPDEEIELEVGDYDEVPFDGSRFDIGEAVAESLSLTIDPYATGPGAEEIREEAGILDEGQSGPFAALNALKKKG